MGEGRFWGMKKEGKVSEVEWSVKKEVEVSEFEEG